jgi:hypothetical protein
MRLRFTDHALANMETRHIAREWVVHCVESPLRLDSDESDATPTLAYLPIADMDGRVLCVVYNHLDDHVVAAFFERRLRGKL